MKQTLILLGLTAYTMAVPLKQRLAQIKETDGGSGGEGLDCSCELPGDIGSGFPDLDQGQFQNFHNSASASQSQSVDTIPDTEWSSQCESACCACNVAQHASEAASTKLRTFTLGGTITVAETVEFTEAGNASEDSVGHSLKATACIVSNQSGSGSAPNQTCLCEDEGNGAV